MVDIQTFSIVIAAASVVAGAIYYTFQVRHLVKTRQTDLVIRLHASENTEELQEAYGRVLSMEFKGYDDFVNRYGELTSEKPVPVAIRMVCGHLAEVGFLMSRKLVEIDLVYGLFSGPAMLTWKKIKPLQEIAQTQLNYPHAYVWVEYLYNEMKKREQKGVKNG
jgi:hypothetical protein